MSFPMKTISNDLKTFQLRENDRLLGELIHNSLFSLHANLRLLSTEEYLIMPVGFFGTSISVTHKGNPIAEIVMTWKGQFVIKLLDNEEEHVLKSTGIFNNTFVVENNKRKICIQLNPKFNWLKSHCEYHINYYFPSRGEKEILIVLLSVYTVNYYIATLTGASSGMI